MKEVLARIEVFEKGVLQAVEKIRLLQRENDILLSNNRRLKEEIVQLKKKLDLVSTLEKEGEEVNLSNNKSQINIEQIKQELDVCIRELNQCIESIHP